MLQPIAISPDYAVSPLLDAAGFALAGELGFGTVLSFLPDGEIAGAMCAAEAQHLAAQHGLNFVHIPAAKFDLFADDIVVQAARVLASASGPVLGICASGQRAAVVWAAASSRKASVEGILAALKAAGFAFDFLRDDLEAQAHRSRWQIGSEPAADQSRAAA